MISTQLSAGAIARPAVIDSSAWLRALEAARLTDRQIELLRFWYQCPGHTMTAPSVAEAMGWKSWTVANRQFGEIAKRLMGALGHPLTQQYWIFEIAQLVGKDRSDHHQLQMRPYFSDAVGRFLFR